MMPHSHSCDATQLDRFLRGDSTLDEQHEVECHLDSCEACQRLIQESAADGSLWQEARRILRQSNLSEGSENLGDTDVCDGTTVSEQIALSILSPTEDPTMLGRFAGYDIAGVIGMGGMGIVLKGFDHALQRYAAIKVLAPHFAACEESRLRFSREGQAAAAVVHENVIGIHGVNVANNLPYLVMPYVRGESLQKRIDRNGPLSLIEILRIAMQTADGLHAAHEQGLVHRDIKPANILLPDGVERVVITDFGLARAADDSRLTQSTVIAGTPQYMSPEQAVGESIDRRSDLFSLGAMMYAMATAQPPFQSETSFGVLRLVREAQPMPIHYRNPKLPKWLWTIVSRLLAKRPEDRYASAADVAKLLRQCLAHLQSADAPLPRELSTFGHFQFRVWLAAKRWAKVGAAIILSSALLAWAAMVALSRSDQAGSGGQPSTAKSKAIDDPYPQVSFNASFEGPDPFLAWRRDKEDQEIIERSWMGSKDEEAQFGRKLMRIPGKGGIQQMLTIAPDVSAYHLSVYANRQGGWAGIGINYRDRVMSDNYVAQYLQEIQPIDSSELRGDGDGLVHYTLATRVPKGAYYAEIWCFSADENGSVTLDNLSLHPALYGPSAEMSQSEINKHIYEFVANGRFTLHPVAQKTGYEFWEPVGEKSPAGIEHRADEKKRPGGLLLGQKEYATEISQSIPVAPAADYRFTLRIKPISTNPLSPKARYKIKGLPTGNTNKQILVEEDIPKEVEIISSTVHVPEGMDQVEIWIHCDRLDGSERLQLQEVSLQSVIK